jgi:hypothetical protein
VNIIVGKTACVKKAQVLLKRLLFDGQRAIIALSSHTNLSGADQNMSDQVKLLLAFDIRPGRENAYRRFIMEEFLPQAQSLGLMPTDAWHTAYGKYPVRLIGFAADDLAVVRTARSTDEWREVMAKLEGYVLNLTLRVVPLHGGFQW